MPSDALMGRSFLKVRFSLAWSSFLNGILECSSILKGFIHSTDYRSNGWNIILCYFINNGLLFKCWKKSKPIALFFRGSLSFLLEEEGGKTCVRLVRSDVVPCQNPVLGRLCPQRYLNSLGRLWSMPGVKGPCTFQSARRERVKCPSPITALEGVIKNRIAGRFLI